MREITIIVFFLIALTPHLLAQASKRGVIITQGYGTFITKNTDYTDYGGLKTEIGYCFQENHLAFSSGYSIWQSSPIQNNKDSNFVLNSRVLTSNVLYTGLGYRWYHKRSSANLIGGFCMRYMYGVVPVINNKINVIHWFDTGLMLSIQPQIELKKNLYFVSKCDICSFYNQTYNNISASIGLMIAFK